LGFAGVYSRNVRAARAMDRHALAAGDKADDGIGWRRLAAACKAGHQPIDADDENAATGAAGTAFLRDDLRRLDRRGLDVCEGLDRGLHLLRIDVDRKSTRLNSSHVA